MIVSMVTTMLVRHICEVNYPTALLNSCTWIVYTSPMWILDPLCQAVLCKYIGCTGVQNFVLEI